MSDENTVQPGLKKLNMNGDKPIIVNVRWWDGYLEVFEASQVRQGAYILWMRLVNGQNRTIPLEHVRWFSTDPESHSQMKPM